MEEVDLESDVAANRLHPSFMISKRTWTASLYASARVAHCVLRKPYTRS